MKPSLVVIFMFLLFPIAEAQQSSAIQTFFQKHCEHVYLGMMPASSNMEQNDKSPFNFIEVIDYRPDTSRIGLMKIWQKQNDLKFKSPASAEIQSFLNKYYTRSGASKTLLVVLKKLSFTDMSNGRQVAEKYSPFRSRINFRAETYVRKNNDYIPLTYIDTSIYSTKEILDIAIFRMPLLMDALMKKVNLIDINSDAINKRKLLSFIKIDSFSTRDFSYPINNADTLQKGVYASFDEFRNNKPTVFNYEIRDGESSSRELLLKDEEGKSYYSRTMWGYCDGQQSYVMIDGSLFPIFFYENAFYVYGSKEYLVKKTIVPIFIIFPAAYFLSSWTVNEKVSRRLRFYNLDIETGEIY